MGRKDFDNLQKLHRVILVNVTTGTLSVEVDLELPRGFIAKISKILFTVFPFAVAVGGREQNVECVLIRDPDDTTTTVIPANAVQHDVIAALRGVFIMEVFTTGAASFVADRKQVLFREDEDVITARNLRFNSKMGLTAPDVNFECEIYYTLEKVTDVDILNLLDIL